MCSGFESMKILKWGTNEYTVLVANSDNPGDKLNGDDDLNKRNRDILAYFGTPDAYKYKVDKGANEEAKGAYDRLSKNMRNCKNYPIMLVTKGYHDVAYAAHQDTQKRKYYNKKWVEGWRSDDDETYSHDQEDYWYRLHIFG